MYNKKYRIEKIEELDKHNPIYEGMEGSVCLPAYLKPGERGWVLYFSEVDDWPYSTVPHRLHTSIVQDVTYYRDNTIIVITEHTKFTFRVIE